MLLKAMFNSPLGVVREMDRLFDSMNSSQPAGFIPTIRSPWAYPAINVWEDADRLVAEAEIPGLTLDQVEVLATEDELTVRGTRAVDVPDEARALRRERPVGAFERTVRLPLPVDSENVEARLTNGVLTITMPKAAAVQPRKIEIRTLPDSD